MTNIKKQTSIATTILVLLSISHLLNDTLQSLIAATYPLLKTSLALSFAQIGIVTLVLQVASSLFQPIVGVLTDKYPQPYSLPIGMTLTLSGLLLLAYAPTYPVVLIAVFFVGIGSAIFHPESTRLAYLASGGQFGLAQSVFQVGGNFGSSLGPLLAIWIITPYGQKYIAFLGIVALLAIILMLFISKWYKANLHRLKNKDENDVVIMKKPNLSRAKIVGTILVLLILIFSKYVYMSSLTNFYMFYLIERFGVDVDHAQLLLFVFLFAVALGTILGGPIGDRIGRKYVIWFSILGAAPFALIMPHVGLVGTCILSVFVGLILSSAFSAILVYAQELMPGKVGLVGGLFFGFSFGVGGIAATTLGVLADAHGIQYVYHICAYFPLLGLVAALLPNMKKALK